MGRGPSRGHSQLRKELKTHRLQEAEVAKWLWGFGLGTAVHTGIIQESFREGVIQAKHFREWNWRREEV